MPYFLRADSIQPPLKTHFIYLLTTMHPGVADIRRVLLFNCTKERDPLALLPALHGGLAAHGVHLSNAFFVLPESQYGFLPTAKQPVAPQQQQQTAVGGAGGASAMGPDLSWQHQLQQVGSECLPRIVCLTRDRFIWK